MDDNNQGSDQRLKIYKREDLVNILKQCPIKQVDKKLEYLDNVIFKETHCDVTTINHILKPFKIIFKKKWYAACRNIDRFNKKNQEWLQAFIQIPVSEPQSETKSGRPTKSFIESSESSKRRKTRILRNETPLEELYYATQMKLRSCGNLPTSKLLTEVAYSPRRAKRARKATLEQTTQKMTGEEALQVFIDANLTSKQYEIIQKADKDRFPCYKAVQDAKKHCYPETIQVTATSIEVKLQCLLNHTAERLFKYIEDVLLVVDSEERKHLDLIAKWGCDGSQQAQYKQKFENDCDSDANIFLSSFVPLRLINRNSQKILWQNPVPSSPRFCRPIRIRYIHETSDITNEEISFINNQISNLEEYYSINYDCTVKFTMLFTMVDGKVCNAATSTKSTMRCYICGVTSKSFNTLKVTEVKEESLTFGLSILHARIRFYEFLLHLSYKLPIKKWQIRSKEDEAVVNATKKKIQLEFRKETGLIIDMPKVGSGNSNDGNSSRRFFADPCLSSRITGIDENLIKRFACILEVISCGFKIKNDHFEKYAKRTAELYVELYSWHPMSPTLHKILLHGPAVISKALLPIGQLSEEAAEARNKHFRTYRQNFARKFSREQCNRDILNRLLLTSDPYHSNKQSSTKRTRKSLSAEALALLEEEIFIPTENNNLDERRHR